jgi:DHA1 family multidrug resistance protein-like MFS transporter
MPVVFYIYGKKIRAKSKFAPAPDIEQDKKRDEEEKAGSSGNNGVNGSARPVGNKEE